MAKKTKKIIFISIAIIIAIGAIVGYMLWNKPHKDVKDAASIKVTAVDLYNTFTTDSTKAKSLYTDKILQVSGEAAQISVNQQAQQIILIKTNTSGAFINCTMEEKAANLKPGDKIIIKGICSGYISGDADMALPGDVFLIRGYSSN